MPYPLCQDCKEEIVFCNCEDLPNGKNPYPEWDQETYDAYSHAVEKERGK